MEGGGIGGSFGIKGSGLSQMVAPWIYPPPPRFTEANDGLAWDLRTKHLKCHPANDWNPLWGVDPRYALCHLGGICCYY